MKHGVAGGAGFTILKSHSINYSAALTCPAVFTVLGQELQRLLLQTMSNFAALAFGGESRSGLSQADGVGGQGSSLEASERKKSPLGQYLNGPSHRHSVQWERAVAITELQRLQMFCVCFSLHLLVFCAELLGIPKNVNNEYVMSSKNESLPCLPLPRKLINPSTKIKTA